MKDKLSSVCLACFALFLILTVARASAAGLLDWFAWPFFAVITAAFGLLTVILRQQVRQDAEREKQQAASDAARDQELSDLIARPDRRYRLEILDAKPTGEPGRFRCEIEIVEDQPAD